MQALLAKMRRLRLLVVGDTMLDRYLWGDAERLSAEAPVPIVKVARETSAAGGAANVALNLRALGIAVDLAGSIGADAAGAQLTALLADRQVGFDPRWARPGRDTITKTRVLCRRQQVCRLDREQDPSHYALTAEDRAALVPRFAAADAVILSDYAKGVVSSDVIRFAQQQARPGALVALDPKPRPDCAFSGVGLLAPNRAEALQLAGLHGLSSASFPAEEAMRQILQRYQPHTLVVTLGAEGMLVGRPGVAPRHIPTAAREVFDVSGAGDTVIAVLTAALAVGASLDDAAALANLAAGVVVGKSGTATATPDEILAYAGLA